MLNIDKLKATNTINYAFLLIGSTLVFDKTYMEYTYTSVTGTAMN